MNAHRGGFAVQPASCSLPGISADVPIGAIRFATSNLRDFAVK
jgi:hypothetical protein